MKVTEGNIDTKTSTRQGAQNSTGRAIDFPRGFTIDKIGSKTSLTEITMRLRQASNIIGSSLDTVALDSILWGETTVPREMFRLQRGLWDNRLDRLNERCTENHNISLETIRALMPSDPINITLREAFDRLETTNKRLLELGVDGRRTEPGDQEFRQATLKFIEELSHEADGMFETEIAILEAAFQSNDMLPYKDLALRYGDFFGYAQARGAVTNQVQRMTQLISSLFDSEHPPPGMSVLLRLQRSNSPSNAAEAVLSLGFTYNKFFKKIVDVMQHNTSLQDTYDAGYAALIGIFQKLWDENVTVFSVVEQMVEESLPLVELINSNTDDPATKRFVGRLNGDMSSVGMIMAVIVECRDPKDSNRNFGAATNALLATLLSNIVDDFTVGALKPNEKLGTFYNTTSRELNLLERCQKFSNKNQRGVAHATRGPASRSAEQESTSTHRPRQHDGSGNNEDVDWTDVPTTRRRRKVQAGKTGRPRATSKRLDDERSDRDERPILGTLQLPGCDYCAHPNHTMLHCKQRWMDSKNKTTDNMAEIQYVALEVQGITPTSPKLSPNHRDFTRHEANYKAPPQVRFSNEEIQQAVDDIYFRQDEIMKGNPDPGQSFPPIIRGRNRQEFITQGRGGRGQQGRSSYTRRTPTQRSERRERGADTDAKYETIQAQLVEAQEELREFREREAKATTDDTSTRRNRGRGRRNWSTDDSDDESVHSDSDYEDNNDDDIDD